ncbi:glycoside hydrolase family 23 protein [Mycena maculata]|uniref:Glycoside hydrolase family 23 protein n=1 Tax=Mycena maculata TaxID=230809 RepID=A0AAD7JVF0_9AGAR|nr:glycoside hydrolase family 23 protein [Mycena maculata]
MLLALPFVILSAVLAVQANLAHVAHAPAHRHARISIPRAPLQSPNLRRRKSCVAPTKASTTSHTTTSHTTTSTKKTTSTTSTKKTTAAAAPTAVTLATTSGGTISVSDSACGSNGATTSITKTTGPNGAIGWLNCGLTWSGGWNPPYITIDQIKSKDLSSAVTESGTPFTACNAYVSLFEQYANQYGLPAIMLASFAMQESSCNPNTVGGAGEQGLMQLTSDKCGNAPGGNCKDVNYNIATGAAYIASTLKDNNGDLLLTIGGYNGWYKGMTKADATAAAYTSCCRCQNNLDYLFQFLNGWMQNVNAYSLGLGEYFNLNVCSD